MCPIVPTLQCGLVRSNFSFAIALSPRLHSRRNQIIPVGFVVRANEFLFLYQFVDRLPLELCETFREALAKNLKAAMPFPEIPHPIPPLARRAAFHNRRHVPFGLAQKPRPDSIPPNHRLKLSPLPCG